MNWQYDEFKQVGKDYAQKEDAELHFKEEFSTYDWIIESMLEHTGFEILDKRMDIGLIAAYSCRKKKT